MSKRILAALGALVLVAIVIAVAAWPNLGKHAMPAPAATEKLLPASAQWPLADVSGLIARADRLMRAKWQEDAVPMDLDAKPAQGGGVEVVIQYYSPGARRIRTLRPNAAGGDLEPERPGDRDTRQSIAPDVADLSAALSRSGLAAGDVQEAELAWTKGGPGAGNVESVQWRLTPTSGSPRSAPAAP